MRRRSETGQRLLARTATRLGLESAPMHRRSLMWVLGAACAVAACQTNSPERSQPQPPAPHGKPRAPVDVRLETSPAGGDRFDVTLVVTPEVAVKDLELVLDGKLTRVGATAAGQRRTVTRQVTLGQLRSRDIVGSATVEVGAHRRRAAALTTIGTPAAAAELPVTIIRMPDGTEVAEVRP